MNTLEVVWALGWVVAVANTIAIRVLAKQTAALETRLDEAERKCRLKYPGREGVDVRDVVQLILDRLEVYYVHRPERTELVPRADRERP